MRQNSIKQMIPVLAALGIISCESNRSGVLTSQDFATAVQQTVNVGKANPLTGRSLFLKNCAHCHGADARGDDGPDLHEIDLTDEQIAKRIRNGKKGQMTAFAGKFSPENISEVIAYLR